MKRKKIKSLTDDSESAIIKVAVSEKKLSFEWYRTSSGCEFRTYLDSLPRNDKERILARIIAIEINGIDAAIKSEWVKKLEDNLYEIRVVGTNQLRGIYFHFINDHYVITNGFTKKQGPVPEEEKEKARLLRARYMEEHKK